MAGEPGIGKSSLLGLLGDRAAERGMVVLEGSGAEFEGGVPFGVFVDALDDHCAGLDPRALAGVPAERLARLASLLPALATERPDGLSPAGERHRTHGAVRTLLEKLAAQRAVVVMIDDLQWVDDSSLELVTHLVRRRPRAAVLLALAYRPPALVRRAGAAQAGFIAGGADELIAPGPLTREQAAALLAGRVEPSRLDAVVVESGGNPFYLEQLAGDRQSAASASGATPTGAPAAVAGSLAGELARLTPQVRAVCLAAAVVGDPFEPHLVAAAAGTTEATALTAIDALVREGTVRQTDVAQRFRFRHPIVRRAAYDAAEPGTRILAHRRVAAALERDGADPLERAQHVAAAARPGDPNAVELLARAGYAASGRAPAIAARWYGDALRLMPASAPPARRIGLLVAMATAQGSAGMLEASRRTLLEVLDALPAELAPMRGRVLPFLALVGHMLGRHGEATALLRRALADLPDPRAAEAAELGIETALDCLYAPDHEAMVRYAVDADHAARQSGDAALEAAGAGVLSLAAYFAGDIPSALDGCTRAVSLVAPLTDGELAGRLEGLMSIAWTAACLERHEDCIAIADRGLAISRSTGQGHLLVPLTIARTVAQTWRGELAAAAASSDELIDAARLTGVGQWIAWALTLRGWVATLAGELDLGGECGEEACAIAAAQVRSKYFVAHSVLHLAETRLAQGRPAECLSTLVAAAGGPELPVCERPVRPRYYEILTRAALELGALEDARGWAARARESATGSSLGGHRCEALLAEAAVGIADGRSAEAEADALEATRVAQQAGDRLLAARAQVLAARAAGTRSRPDAIALLEHARSEFDACGAVRSSEETVRELRRLGRRVGGGGRRGAGTRGVAALSGREQEVARLVTDGLTNREIAARLVLSDRTVETHLSAVFRKLDVHGRAAVAAALWRDRSAK